MGREDDNPCGISGLLVVADQVFVDETLRERERELERYAVHACVSGPLGVGVHMRYCHQRSGGVCIRKDWTTSVCVFVSESIN